MRNTTERRQMILQVLCERRNELAENLALEFGVSIRTIYYDIENLSYSYPIFTTKGTGGGVHVVDGFRLGMKYLTDKQYTVLKEISEELSGEKKVVVLEIIRTFAYPMGEKNGKKRT